MSQEILKDEIDLYKLFEILWRKKIFIITLTFFAAIFSIFYSLSLPNIYTSKSLVASNISNHSSGDYGSFSSLVGIAGLPPIETHPKAKEAIARIKSFEFFEDYFLPSIKLENLMAVSEWNRKDDSIIYNEKIFDVESGKWKRNVSFPKQAIPSNQEAFKVFQNLLNVNENIKTGFINISISHQSPNLAKKWVDLIISKINENLSEVDKEAAKRSIIFLESTLINAKIQSVKRVVSNLLEAQVQTLMLASSNEEYVFKVLDSPIAPEIKSSPRRSIICIIGTLMGGFLSILVVLFQFYRKSFKS